ncbi:MAG: DEAD/DEAH box helicase [Hydrogenothermaceae bacterium]|nr:DEAD/DEAH box helicase [Hydrogenothermaceae bacterium]
MLDEAHNIKNSETLKSKAVKFISKRASYKWALSETPLQNHILDILSVYEFLNPEKRIDRKISEDEIKDLIRPIMLRRLKRDIIRDLPEKLPPEVERFELSHLQKEYYEKLLSAEKRRIEGVFKKHRFEKNFSFIMKQNIIYSLQKLRQICNFPPESISSPKSDRMLEMIKEIVDNDEKVVIFSNFVKEGVDKIVKNLRNVLPADSIVTFHGGLNESERDNSVDRFMNDDRCKVFVGTLGSSSEGLTLTAGNYVIFFELHWNPAKMWQAEDRVHRIGQKNRVNIYYFITKGTVEERIIQRLSQKKRIIENIIDSDIDEIESITLEELLDFIDLKISV